jgi:O-antigen/teichoic acid export membrane protein
MATLGFDVISRSAGAVSAIILLRSLHVAEYAYLVVFLAVAQTLSTASTGGIKLGYLRREAERVSRGLERQPLFLPVAIVGTVALAAFSVGGWTVSEIFQIGPGQSGRSAFWAGVLIYGFGQSTSDLLIYHHQAQLAFRRAGGLNLARSILLLASSLVIAAGVMRSGVQASLLLALTVTAFSLVAASGILRSDLRRGIGHLSLRATLADTPWLTVYSIASAAYSNSDVLLVAALLSRYDVAVFGVAQRYYAIALGAVPSLIVVFRVRTSQVDVVDSIAAQRRLLLDWTRRVAPLVAVGAIVGAIAAPLVLPVISHGRYPQAVAVFQILTVYAAGFYLSLPAPSLLMARHRYALLAKLTLAEVTADVIGDIIAAPTAGLIGVAIAATVVNCVFSGIDILAVLRVREAEPARATAVAGGPAAAPSGGGRT